MLPSTMNRWIAGTLLIATAFMVMVASTTEDALADPTCENKSGQVVSCTTDPTAIACTPDAGAPSECIGLGFTAGPNGSNMYDCALEAGCSVAPQCTDNVMVVSCSAPSAVTCYSSASLCAAVGFSTPVIVNGAVGWYQCDSDGSPGCGHAANCSFNGITVNNGDSVTAYESDTEPSGSYCESETRTCNNGVLSGSYAYAACTVALMPDDGLDNP